MDLSLLSLPRGAGKISCGMDITKHVFRPTTHLNAVPAEGRWFLKWSAAGPSEGFSVGLNLVAVVRHPTASSPCIGCKTGI